MVYGNNGIEYFIQSASYGSMGGQVGQAYRIYKSSSGILAHENDFIALEVPVQFYKSRYFNEELAQKVTKLLNKNRKRLLVSTRQLIKDRKDRTEVWIR